MSSQDRSPEAELAGWLSDDPIKPHEVARFLDGLSHDERVEATRSLGRSQQRRLYDAVDAFRPLRLADLVPPGTGALVPVRHFGKNTLPAFSHFEKRFCRPRTCDAEQPDSLYGFNFQSMSVVTGPGYFTAVPSERAAEVLVDYREIPPEHPDGWPEIRRNDRGLSRFVYGFMVDTLRGVSEHVTIGSAARNGKDLGSWFALCREA